MAVQPILLAESDYAQLATSPAPACRRLRVLHVINGEHYSGAERVQDLLAMCLPEQGFDVEFACVKPQRFPRVRCSRGPLHEVSMRSRIDLTAARAIARLVRQRGITLLHAHTPRSALVASLAARWTRVPLVYHVHSPTSRDSTVRWRNWINAWNERFCTSSAARLITVSHSLAAHMRQRGYAAEQITVVPNGVPLSVRRRSASPPGGTWTLGTVALFRPRKGLEVLIEALAILRRRKHFVRLRAVGSFETPAYERAIRQWVDYQGVADDIQWTGFTTDVAQELLLMDLFVLPSLFGEGLPMVVLEAMAAGVPVLATKVEGVPEAIEHGCTGLLAEPGSAAELAEQISGLLEGRHDWTALRAGALDRHARQFSDRAMAAGVARVYRELLPAGTE